MRFTLSLLAGNLILFGFIFYLHHQGHPDRMAREQARKVFGPEAVNLTFLEIQLSENDSRVLQRRSESSNWDLRSPVQWPANVFAVNRILQQLESLEKEISFRTSDLERTGYDLAQYGLEEPRAVLVFGRGSQRHKVRIGAPTDTGNRLYILDPTGEWIHVVHREFYESLSINLTQLQSDTVFRVPLFEVRSLNLQLGSHSKVRLARDENEWAFETPFQTRADRTAVEAVINRLNKLQIHQFLGSETDGFGLNNPSMRITLEGNSRRESLLVGKPAPDRAGEKMLYAKLADNPTAFTVRAEAIQALENSQDLLRDRKLLQLSAHQLNSVKVEVPGHSEVLLQRLETDQWQIVSRYADQSVRILPADTELVDRLLTSLDETYVLRFENDAPSDADLARYGFDQPQRAIILGGESGASLLLGNHVPESNGGAVFARLGDSRFVYTVDASILREAPASTNYFRDRLLLPQPDGAIITSLKIRDVNTGSLVFESSLPSPEATWKEATAEMPEEKREALLSLLPALRNLRVKRYIHDGFAPVISIDDREIPFSYALEAELLLVGGETPRKTNLEILFTERLGGQTLLAGSRSLNVVFSVRQNMIDALGPLLLDEPARPEEETAANQGDEKAPDS